MVMIPYLVIEATRQGSWKINHCQGKTGIRPRLLPYIGGFSGTCPTEVQIVDNDSRTFPGADAEEVHFWDIDSSSEVEKI
jgi:hypothetical protein